jgi:hypothetical protein
MRKLLLTRAQGLSEEPECLPELEQLQQGFRISSYTLKLRKTGLRSRHRVSSQDLLKRFK